MDCHLILKWVILLKFVEAFYCLVKIRHSDRYCTSRATCVSICIIHASLWRIIKYLRKKLLRQMKWILWH